MISPALLIAVALAASPVDAQSNIKLGDSQRRASLLLGTSLENDYQPSHHPSVRLMDDVKFLRGEGPTPLDQGGGLSGETKQILALILGFIPGFGLGHLIAGDRDGFILFLIIDIVLWVVGGFVGAFWGGGIFWGLGGLVWLVVHIFQAIDAYGAAGGPRLVEKLRERAVRIAAVPGKESEPLITTRVWSLSF